VSPLATNAEDIVMNKSRDAFRTISEVAEWLGTPAHVLRFWESKFTQVKPVKRAGGRRYYRPADMELLGGIKTLLHDEGMTIKGVQKVLREQGVKHVAALAAEPVDYDDADDLSDEIEEAPFADVPEPDDIVVPFASPKAAVPQEQPISNLRWQSQRIKTSDRMRTRMMGLRPRFRKRRPKSRLHDRMLCQRIFGRRMRHQSVLDPLKRMTATAHCPISFNPRWSQTRTLSMTSLRNPSPPPKSIPPRPGPPHRSRPSCPKPTTMTRRRNQPHCLMSPTLTPSSLRPDALVTCRASNTCRGHNSKTLLRLRSNFAPD
jgi:DNA-binding transcriptional MerR regulator